MAKRTGKTERGRTKKIATGDRTGAKEPSKRRMRRAARAVPAAFEEEEDSRHRDHFDVNVVRTVPGAGADLEALRKEIPEPVWNVLEVCRKKDIEGLARAIAKLDDNDLEELFHAFDWESEAGQSLLGHMVESVPQLEQQRERILEGRAVDAKKVRGYLKNRGRWEDLGQLIDGLHQQTVCRFEAGDAQRVWPPFRQHMAVYPKNGEENSSVRARSLRFTGAATVSQDGNQAVIDIAGSGEDQKTLAGRFECMIISTPGQPFVIDISSLLPVSVSDVHVVASGLRRKGTSCTPLAVNWEVDGTSGLALKLWAYDAEGNPPTMSDIDWAGAEIKIDYQIMVA